MRMKRRWKVLLLVALICGGLVCWLKPRDYTCQRCGAGMRMCGPVIIAYHIHYMSGAGGDVELYCIRHGHMPVRKFDPDKKVDDWMYHRDSYATVQAYLADPDDRQQHK